eukprot:748540-Rhodomonas_salina.1
MRCPILRSRMVLPGRPSGGPTGCATKRGVIPSLLDVPYCPSVCCCLHVPYCPRVYARAVRFLVLAYCMVLSAYAITVPSPGVP